MSKLIESLIAQIIEYSPVPIQTQGGLFERLVYSIVHFTGFRHSQFFVLLSENICSTDIMRFSDSVHCLGML